MDYLVNILEKENIPIFEIVEMLSFDKEELIEYAIKNMICPKCYADLKVHKWDEGRGECFGFQAYEKMSELVCENCGSIY